MGKKITDYVPTLTLEDPNKVILYMRGRWKNARDDCHDPDGACTSCPNFLSRVDYPEAMRLSHMLGKRKLEYKKIKEVL